MPALSLAGRPAVTFRDVASEKIGALCSALNLPGELRASAIRMFDLLSGAWAVLPVGETPPWSNDISDDGTPFELSVAFEGTSTELRMLVEPQLLPRTATSNWEAGLAVNERVRLSEGADLASFERVRDLFEPRGAADDGRFSCWHSAVLREDGSAFYKVYLNPQVAGPRCAPALIEEALLRLGLADAWRFLASRLSPSARGSDVRYFALDLARADVARVKVYLAHESPAASIEDCLRGAAHVRQGDATRWLEVLTGTDNPFEARPVLTCFSFTSAKVPPSATVHVPVRCYGPNDAEIMRRVATLVSPSTAAMIHRVVTTAASRPLGDRPGLIAYASLRPTAAAPRLTLYVSAETYAGRAQQSP